MFVNDGFKIRGWDRTSVFLADILVVPCYLDCRPSRHTISLRGHYHCVCGIICLRKESMENHVRVKHSDRTIPWDPLGLLEAYRSKRKGPKDSPAISAQPQAQWEK